MLLPTIISRCQVIKLNKKKCSYDTISNLSDLLISYGYNDISDDNKEKIINDVIEFTEYIENYKLDTLIYTKKLWQIILRIETIILLVLI